MKTPTRSDVLSCVAIFVALGGTSMAAGTIFLGPGSIGPKMLRRNAVTTRAIRNASITPAKISGPVPTSINAAHASTASTATTAGSAPVSRVVYETQTVPFRVVSCGDGCEAAPDPAATVYCPAGTDVVGGGVSTLAVAPIIRDAPIGHGAWTAVLDNSALQTGVSATVYAICVPVAAP